MDWYYLEINENHLETSREEMDSFLFTKDHVKY